MKTKVSIIKIDALDLAQPGYTLPETDNDNDLLNNSDEDPDANTPQAKTVEIFPKKASAEGIADIEDAINALDELSFGHASQAKSVEDFIKDAAAQGVTGIDDAIRALDALFGAANLPRKGNLRNRSANKTSNLSHAEQQLAKLADVVEGRRREEYYVNPSDACDGCGCNLIQRAFFVDGQLRRQSMFSSLCAECFLAKGEGIGWGKGQLYQKEPDGECLLVAGFPPKEK